MRCGLQIDAVRPFAAPMLASNTHSEGSYCEKALSFGVQTTCWALSLRYFCVDIEFYLCDVTDALDESLIAS